MSKHRAQITWPWRIPYWLPALLPHLLDINKEDAAQSEQASTVLCVFVIVYRLCIFLIPDAAAAVRIASVLRWIHIQSLRTVSSNHNAPYEELTPLRYFCFSAISLHCLQSKYHTITYYNYIGANSYLLISLFPRYILWFLVRFSCAISTFSPLADDYSRAKRLKFLAMFFRSDFLKLGVAIPCWVNWCDQMRLQKISKGAFQVKVNFRRNTNVYQFNDKIWTNA